MAEELRIKNGDKQEMYETLLPQIASLVGNETDLIANMATLFPYTTLFRSKTANAIRVLSVLDRKSVV